MQVAQPPVHAGAGRMGGGREQQKPSHRLRVYGKDQAPGRPLEAAEAGGQAAVIPGAVDRDRQAQAAVSGLDGADGVLQHGEGRFEVQAVPQEGA